MTYGLGCKKTRIVCSLPDGTIQPVFSLPSKHICAFRERMLQKESSYPEGKRRHYTLHTKNPRLAILESALHYLITLDKGFDNKIDSAKAEFECLSKKRSDLHTSLQNLEKKQNMAISSLCRASSEYDISDEIFHSDLDACRNRIATWKYIQPTCGAISPSCLSSILDSRIFDSYLEYMEHACSNMYSACDYNARIILDMTSTAISGFGTRPIFPDSCSCHEDLTIVANSKPQNAAEAVAMLGKIDANACKSALSGLSESENSWLSVTTSALFASGDEFARYYAISSECKRLLEKFERERNQFPKARENEANASEDKKETILRPFRDSTIAMRALMHGLYGCCELRLGQYRVLIDKIFFAQEVAKIQSQIEEKIENLGPVNREFSRLYTSIGVLEKKKRSLEPLMDLVKEEIRIIRERIRTKEINSRTHLERSPKSFLDGLGILKMQPKSGQISGVQQAELKQRSECLSTIETSISDFVEKAWAHPEFEEFARENPGLKKRFCQRMRMLAGFYIKRGGKLLYSDIISGTSANFRSECCSDRGSNGFILVRVGFAKLNYYRFIMDLEKSEAPALYFIGAKPDSGKFLDNRQFKRERQNAEEDGRAQLFSESLAPALSAYEKLVQNGWEKKQLFH